MSALFLTVILLGAAPNGGIASAASVPSDSEAEASPVVPLRTGTELEEAVRTALRRWARPSDKDADLAAREFLVLYKEIQQDTKLPRAQREQYRNKVRSRLAAVSQQIAKRVASQQRRADGERPRSVGGAQQVPPLAQMAGGPQRGGMGMGGIGGPGGGAANDDYGQGLIDLIQATIAPHTWDVNGGPGSIYYFRSNHSMVVRAGEEVHENLIDLLEQLHRASN